MPETMPQTTSSLPAFIPLLVAALGYVFSVVTAERARRLEKRNVTRALLTEIHTLNLAVASRLEWLATIDRTKWLPPLAPFTIDAYDHLADKLAVLDDRAAPNIVQYYGYIRFINALQLMKAEYELKDDGEAFFTQYENTLERHAAERGEGTFDKLYEMFGLPWAKSGKTVG